MAKQLIVAGFHRSGTSLIMQYLDSCGLFIGYDLIGANDSNPYGHFEDREIVRTHDWILAANQASWMVDRPFTPNLDEVHWARLRSIIGRRDGEHRVWGFKDPRVCNFLAHWKRLLPDAKVLIVFRNPCECIHSLHRRHAHELFKQKGDPEVHRRFFKEPDLALRMWSVHNAALVAFARAYPGDVLVLHHGTFKQGFPLAAKLNELWDFGLTRGEVSAVYDEKATRSTHVRARAADAALVEEALEIWRTLAALERETTGIADLQTESALARNQFVFDRSAAIIHSEKELLGFENEALRSANEKLQKEMAGRGAEIASLRAELEVHAREITGLRSSLAASTSSLAASTSEAAKLKSRLDEIKTSTAWKVAKPTWKVERWLRRRTSTHLKQRAATGPRLSTPVIESPARNDDHLRSMLSAVVLPQEYRNAAIVIIVPVYNAASDVQACLDSLVAHTSRPASVLIIDDASTDPEIPPLLDRFSVLEGITVLRNERNLGFTRTVNNGIALAGGADVVLLNSDAIVTPRWLENLHLAAYSYDRIATVTPLSDNAGAFSVPEFGAANARPTGLEQDVYARMITQRSAMVRPSVPTGNGFCMYIRRACIDEVGTFDEAAFPRGYGEENDFCMRAVHSGWTNIVDDRTIVYHRRSASFGEEKHELMRRGAAILDGRYPEYKTLIKVFRGRQFDLIRDRVRSLNAPSGARPGSGKPRVLFVISVRTGGTALTNADLMSGVRNRYEPWLLRCDARRLELGCLGSEGMVSVASHTLAQPITAAEHVSAEYDRVVEQWLLMYAIELVHIRHISWNSLNLVHGCSSLHIPVVFSFHDYYCVCPTVKLLDENMRFCRGACTETPGECTAELWPRDAIPPLKNRWVRNWRSLMWRMLRDCDAYVTTSVSARDIIVASFPELGGKDFRVIPHGRSFEEMHQYAAPLQGKGPVRILALGNINAAKGGDIIGQLVDRDEHGTFEFHVLGKVDARLNHLRKRGVVLHGSYERDKVAPTIKAIAPHFGAVFSLWGETYCHTLTELWACGLPVLTFDMGALGERIRAAGGGWLLPHDDLDALFASMCAVAQDRQGIRDRVAEVMAWQRGEGRWNDVERMANSYMSLYEQVLEARRTFPAASGSMATSGRLPAALAKAAIP